MKNKEDKNNIKLKKNIPLIKSSKLLNIPFQKNFQVSKLNQIYTNNSLNKIKNNQKNIIDSNIYKNNNFNRNDIRNKLISKIFKKINDINYQNDILNKNDIKKKFFKTKNIVVENNTVFNIKKKNDNFNLNLNTKNECCKSKINDYNNIQLFNNDIYDNFKTPKIINKTKVKFKSILFKKNLSTFYKYNTSLDLNINKEKNIIISLKNNKLLNNNINNIKQNKNKRKINSLCQTKISIFDINKEKNDEKEIINTKMLPSLYTQQKRLEEYLNEKMNENIIQKNNKSINNDRRKALSFDTYKNINNYKLKKPLNYKMINQKRKINFEKPVCIVKNFYLSFDIKRKHL